MNNIMVTLLSEKPAELSRFLKSFYNKEIITDETSFKWSCYYSSPIESIILLSVLMENNDDYKIEALISLDNSVTIKITEDNINDIIKILI